MSGTRSGFCNPDNPRTDAYDPHRRCPWPATCPCTCHTEEPTMPETTAPPADLTPTVDPDTLPTLDVSGTETVALDPASIIPLLHDVTSEHAVRMIVAAVGALNTALAGDGLGSLGVEAALTLLHRLRAALGEAKQLDTLVAKHVYLTAEHGRYAVDGVGPVFVGRTRSRKAWEEREVLRAVVDSHMTEREGEAPDDPMEVVDWLLEAHRFDDFRVTALRARGIDPKDYCVDVPGNVSVTVG